MFKKINNVTEEGSPMLEVNATVYWFGRYTEAYDEWVSAMEKGASVDLDLNKDLMTDRGGLIVRIDVSDVKLANICAESLTSTSEFVLLDLALCQRLQLLAVTDSCRWLTPAERRMLEECSKEVFFNFAVDLGAMYVVLEVDGEKTLWYNDESCYNYCKKKKMPETESDFLKDFHVWVSGLSEDQKKEMVDSAIKKTSGEFSDKISKTEEEKLASETRNFLLNYFLKA